MNRILGTLFALGVIVVMVFAVLNAGNYTSMCFQESEQVVVVETDTLANDPAIDSSIDKNIDNMDVEATDSLSVAMQIDTLSVGL